MSQNRHTPTTVGLPTLVRHKAHTAIYSTSVMDREDMDTEIYDVHKSLQPSRLEVGEVALNNLLDAFKDFTNPFNLTTNVSKSLYCLNSGQSASDKVSYDLLAYIGAGKDAAEQCIATRLTQKTC